MVAEIPSDLLDLLTRAIEGNIEDYTIDLLNNEKGEGFVAEIIFINLTQKGSGEETHLIVKQEQVKDGETVEKFREICQNEIYFYDVVWPFLKKFYSNVGKRDLDFVPKCFGTSNTNRARIILENIKPQGFMCYDKRKPFDDEHCKLIFETYGIYHGISMALSKLDTEQYNKLIAHKTNVFKKLFEQEYFVKSFFERIKTVQKYFESLEDKPVLEKLKMYEESGLQMIISCMNEDFPNGVILHGDCWSNNMMFKNDEQNKPEAVKLIDFQLLCHGPPVFDLSYCFYSGASGENLNKLDHYLKIYHTSLSNILKEFGMDPETVYPLDTFKEDWKKYCRYGLPLALIVWKMKLLSKDDVPDLTETPALIRPIALSEDSTDVYKRIVRDLIIHMDTNDFL